VAQKRRHPHSWTGHRRSRWTLAPVPLVTCPQCKARVLPHRVCPACGTYAGREVVIPRARSGAKKKRKEA
jgi:large subunit ribosomal protein L32